MSAQVEALVTAANKGDLPSVQQLLQQQPSLASAPRESDGNHERCPALCRAAANGHVEVVRALLKHGADPNAMYRDDYGTALTAACETLAHGAGDTVKLLLDAGADASLADALFVAISTYARNPAEKHKVVKHLTARGEHAGQPPAVLAVHAGDLKALTALLARDPGLLERRFPAIDYLSWPLHLGAPTLLHLAADACETAIVELLLAAGADVNVRAGPGEGGCGYQTPVFHCVAAQNGAGLDVLKLLIARRADLGVTAKLEFPADEAHGLSPHAGKVVDLKPLGLALQFEKAPAWRNSAQAVTLLRDAGAVE